MEYGEAKELAGDGGAFRGMFGSWILGLLAKFNVHSPLTAELYAISEGLVIAKGSYVLQHRD